MIIFVFKYLQQILLCWCSSGNPYYNDNNDRLALQFIFAESAKDKYIILK